MAASLDQLGLRAPAVVGHSVGGWTALELAKLGRAGSVLALATAGLWRKHSPWLIDLELQVNWRLGQLLWPSVTERVLRTRHGRQLALRSISARPGNVPYDAAIAMARAAHASQHFPEHLRRTRVLRFAGGRELPAELPIADELIARVRRAGAVGEILLRADSGFHNQKLRARLAAKGVLYSISVRLTEPIVAAIELIDEDAWAVLEDYPKTGEAQIAETTIKGERLIVRRV